MIEKNVYDEIRFGFTVLGSGSDGNATVIHAPGGNFLLDAGFNASQLIYRMRRSDINPHSIHAILVTHRHIDHVSGCRVFADKYNIPAYTTVEAYLELFRHNKKLLPKNIVVISPGTSFNLCGLTIEAFQLSHDVDTVGYTFSLGDHRFGYATDFGAFGESFVTKMNLCDAIVLESNHDPKMLLDSPRPYKLKVRIGGTIGHLSNEQAMNCVSQIIAPRTKKIVFAHLSRECNSPYLVEKMAHETLRELGRDDVSFSLACQDDPLETYWLEK